MVEGGIVGTNLPREDVVDDFSIGGFSVAVFGLGLRFVFGI